MRRDSSMRITVDNRWRVRAECDVALPVSAAALWGQMRDFPRFCAMDPLHRRVRVQNVGFPPRGARLILGHRLLGLGPDRVGRVLKWTEGRGYAFSDLSRRGNHVGFPHVCAYDIHAVDDRSTVLTISARGLWTMRVLPRPLVRWWLAFVLRETARTIHAEMTRFARWRNQNASGS